MTSHRQMVVVTVVSILAVGPAVVGLATFNAFPSPSCSVPATNSTSPANNSTRVLVPAGDEMSIPHSGETFLKFSVDSAAELTGAWSSSARLGITVGSNLLLGSSSEPILPGYFMHGEFNESPFYPPLFPGTYFVTAYPWDWWIDYEPPLAPTNLTVTQSIEIVFDRGLTILQRPAGLNVSANYYACWPILFPAGARDVWWLLPPLLASTTEFTLALFPQALFQQFQTDPGVISSPQVWEIWQGSMGVQGGDFLLPLNVTSGAVLVFYNWSPDGATLTVAGSIEISYVVGS